jgi:hypothetical protein
MEELRGRFEAWWSARARAGVRSSSGLDPGVDLERIDDEFGDVTSGAALDSLRKEAAEGAWESTRDAARRLGLGITSAVVRARTREGARRLAERAAAQTVRVGREVGRVLDWQVRLGAESDPVRRRAIDDALAGATAELNELRLELLATETEALAELGHPTPVAWAEALRPGVDLAAWSTRAERVLALTESAWNDALRRRLPAAKVALERAHRGDLEFALRLHPYDRYFSAAALRPAFDYTALGLGIRLDDVGGIDVDDEARPGKDPRAHCVGERIPGAVHVLLPAFAGVAACEALFAACGRALRLAFTSSALPVEFRLVSDPGLDEGFGQLWASRVADPGWVPEGPAAAKGEPFLADARFRRLGLLRMHAATLRFERELQALPAGSDARPTAEIFGEELSRATGVRWPDALYLARYPRASGAHSLSVDVLRGWCLEAQLAEELRMRFGHRFWRERACGELLKELWNTGGTYTAEELAHELGLGGLEVDLLIAQLSGGPAS